MKWFILLALVSLFGTSVSKKTSCYNDRPIVGVLYQRLTNRNILRNFPFTRGRSFVHASYVKWIESAGARVVPIKDGMKESELKELLGSINGVVFPGGISSLYTSNYSKTGRTIFNHAVKAKDFPLMGICLGFQLLIRLVAARNLLQRTDAKRISMKMAFMPYAARSKMFMGLPARLKRMVRQKRLAFNSHKWGIYPRDFKRNSRLSRFFNILATSKDRKGIEFVAAMEAKGYPIFGVQWHPEKPSFEWSRFLNISRSQASIEFAQFMANTFIKRARKNCNKFKSRKKEGNSLIYSHYPIYSGEVSSVEQTYIL